MHVPRKGYTTSQKALLEGPDLLRKGEERMGTKMEDMAKRKGRAD